MKIALMLAIATAALGAGAVSTRQPAAQRQTAAAAKPDSPFYCDLKALGPEQRRHKEELGKALRAVKKDIRELPDGFAFELPMDAATIQAAAEWAELERRCCPFFDIDLRLEREGGKFWLRLTGREGVKQFIHADFSPWF